MVSTVQEKEVVALALPVRLSAFTPKVWPAWASPVNVFGLVQPVKAAPSSAQV